jgi:hypothetical protein
MESYHGIFVMKRIPGIPGESPEPPGTSGDPPGTPLGPPLGRPGTPIWDPWDPKIEEMHHILKGHVPKVLGRLIVCARNKLNGTVMISFADVIYDKKILRKLIGFKGDCGIAVRKDWKKAYKNRSLHPISEADNVLLNVTLA